MCNACTCLNVSTDSVPSKDWPPSYDSLRPVFLPVSMVDNKIWGMAAIAVAAMILQLGPLSVSASLACISASVSCAVIVYCCLSITYDLFFGSCLRCTHASDVHCKPLISQACNIGHLKLSVILAGTKGSFGDTHAHLSSGHGIFLLGWGSFHASAEDAVTAVQDAVNAGFRVGARVPATVSAGNCWKIGCCVQHILLCVACGYCQSIRQ